ncbi:LysR family transcriptional regulator [Burkholderia pseudomallei MSHR338]|uniref:LysR family transcriptional regulator n=1 Tax=Burkholderia pseudomallei TaxID=28450 RepID=UPI0003AC8959|nr:LysR family transcriptional regulator [Burkholderia pseudomallei]AIP11303.1 bacterial regulatory helix-turn-helix, lysR family protein [Burkholderia pseudomallei]EQA90329.1 LysR family transcriptional regulator [Burkholderia pseudomallei MSHR338]
MNLELRHYRYFVTLAEELHFGRAAERAGISQPALSQQIRIIEGTVGTPLLTRSNRRLGLTEVGMILYEEALAVLRQVQQAELATSRASRGEAGSLSIGYVASAVLSGVLPKLVHAFRQDHPLVSVVMRETAMPDLVSAVDIGELNLGFIRPPVPCLPERIALLDVTAEPIVAVLHAQHPLARRPSIDVSQLRDETFICTHTQAGTGFYATTVAICEGAGFQPRIEALSNQMSTIISMVAAGFGVAFIPASMTNFSQPDVVFKSLAHVDSVSRLSVAYRKNVRAPTVLNMLDRCRVFAREAERGPAAHAGRRPRT